MTWQLDTCISELKLDIEKFAKFTDNVTCEHTFQLETNPSYMTGHYIRNHCHIAELARISFYQYAYHFP